GHQGGGSVRGGRAPQGRDGAARGAEGWRGARGDEVHWRVPHGRVHEERVGPRGALPVRPRPRGRGGRGRGRIRRDERGGRGPCDPAVHPRVPRVQKLPEPQDEPLHGDPLDAGAGPHARRHEQAFFRRRPALSLHGHLDLREPRGAAGDSGRQDPRGRPVREGLLHRVRGHDGDRGRDLHRGRRAGRERRRLRARGHRPERRAGREARGGRQDHRRRPQPGAQGHGREVRHDPLREPERGRGRSRPLPRRPDRRRRGLHLRVHRQRQRHAPGARMLPQGLGRLRYHRRRGGRTGDLHAPVPARDRQGLEGLGLRRRARAHRRPEDRGLVHAGQDRDRPPHHPHDGPRRHKRGLRPDAQGRVHPQRRELL
ncbi:MAG: S-(hydroxymethyl)glutathione dehydrogenase, partial [uncultured Rubrobacteraceae bacterium]